MNRLFAFVNPFVVKLAGSFAHVVISHQVLVLHFVGRRSGRRYQIPVSYLQHDGALLCMTARSGLWWRNLQGEVPVQVTLRGQVLAAAAAVGAEDAARIAAALKQFCLRSRISAFFAGVGFDGPEPRDQDLARGAQQQVLIRLELC